MYENLENKTFKSLKQQMKKMIRELPQSYLFENDRISAWCDSVLEREPDRAIWHVKRLMGLGGSEIGVLIGDALKEFHPHTSARELIKQKLLLEGLSEKNGHLERGTEMEELVQKKYRKMISKRGAISILTDEVIKIIGEYKNEKHTWLVGNPDDIIMEENGDVYIVDYKVPTEDSFNYIMSTGCPVYYAAQLHHYKIIIDALKDKLGFSVKGLKLVPFDMRLWKCYEMDVNINPKYNNLIFKIGDLYWNDYVLKGLLPPIQTIKSTEELDNLDIVLYDEDKNGNFIEVDYKDYEIFNVGDFYNKEEKLTLNKNSVREQMKNIIKMNYGFAQVAKASNDLRESTSTTLRALLPENILLNSEVNDVSYNGVKIKIDRNMDENVLLDGLKLMSEKLNFDYDMVLEVINNPKNRSKTIYNVDKLLQLLIVNNNLDIQNEKNFQKYESAIEKKSEVRIDVLVNLIKKLDINSEFNYIIRNATDQDNIKISVVMPRDTGDLLLQHKEEVLNDIKNDVVYPYVNKNKNKNMTLRSKIIEVQKEKERLNKEQEEREKLEKKRIRENKRLEKEKVKLLDKMEKQQNKLNSQKTKKMKP